MGQLTDEIRRKKWYKDDRGKRWLKHGGEYPDGGGEPEKAQAEADEESPSTKEGIRSQRRREENEWRMKQIVCADGPGPAVARPWRRGSAQHKPETCGDGRKE